MTEPKTCPRCGAPIRPDETPAGLCAACLMRMGLDSRSGAAEVVLTETDTPRPPAPTIAELAPHFPELEIVELVGRGGMGAVYRAKQRSLERDVALKVLTVGTDDATFADRFQREARTLASLSHPGITAVHDFGQRGPWSFLAMEFVEGASLRQMLRARTLGPRESLTIVTQMCDALQYAHDKGVVHRDIKPENVLVTRDGRVKVLDFGLAKLVGQARRDNLTQARQVMGTPHYMAPEQWEKPLAVDHRADIYAMGVVFYELLTGELPIGRFAPPSHKVAVDVRLDDVVLRSLEKEPDRRYQHASQVKDDVDGITTTPGGAPPPVPVEPVRERSGARKWIVAGSVLGCLILLMVPLGILFFFFLPVAGSRAELAQQAALEQADRSLTAAADAAYVKAYFKSMPESLVLPAEVADKLGIPPDRVEALNHDLERVWNDYLEWVASNVQLRWLSADTIEADASSAGVPPPAFIKRAEEAISRVTAPSLHPQSAYQRLMQFVGNQMLFGRPEWGRFTLTMSNGAAILKTRDGLTHGELPASRTLRRLWDRAMAERDGAPK